MSMIFFVFKVNNMKYWHPHLPFGQHISVSTLVPLKEKSVFDLNFPIHDLIYL